MSLFLKTIPSVTMPCALCTEHANISDRGVTLSFCCENPICLKCSSKSLPYHTFCLICCRPQRLSNGGILYAQESLKHIFPDKHWHERKKQIEAFFAKARTMPGCSFFLHWNRYSWKNLDTLEIAEKYKLFCEEMNKTTIVFFWTRFCSLRGYPIVSRSKSYIVYSTHPFFPWIPERRKVMSRCQFGFISTIAKRLVSEKQGSRDVFHQIIRRFLARS
jgi:hypothetical protein